MKKKRENILNDFFLLNSASPLPLPAIFGIGDSWIIPLTKKYSWFLCLYLSLFAGTRERKRDTEREGIYIYWALNMSPVLHIIFYIGYPISSSSET